MKPCGNASIRGGRPSLPSPPAKPKVRVKVNRISLRPLIAPTNGIRERNSLDVVAAALENSF
jgi:hypothetical protein